MNPVLIHEEKPVYVPAAIRAKIQGLVELSVTVLPDGSVDPETITVTTSLDRVYGLDNQAIAAAKRWTFTPATLAATGAAVRCRVTIRMTFTLKDSPLALRP